MSVFVQCDGATSLSFLGIYLGDRACREIVYVTSDPEAHRTILEALNWTVGREVHYCPRHRHQRTVTPPYSSPLLPPALRLSPCTR